MGKPFTLTADRGRPEEIIQRQCAAMLRAYAPASIWWTASLSGVPLSPQARATAKACGLERGAPDLSFILPDGRSVYVEMKARDGVLTVEQKRVAALLGPERFVVCRSWPDLRQALSGWLAPHGERLLTDVETVRRGVST